MTSRLYQFDSGLYRSLFIGDGSILISANRQSSAEDFEGARKAPKWRNLITEIPFEEINTLKFKEGGEALELIYKKVDGKLKSIHLGFDNSDFPSEIAEFLLGELNLQITAEDKKSKRNLWANAFFALLGFGSGYSFYHEALIYTNNPETAVYGTAKTKILHNLIIELSGIITPYGILCIGFAFGFFFLWKTYKALKPEFVRHYIYRRQ